MEPAIPISKTLELVILIVQIIGGVAMLVAMVTAIWSLVLQKKEVITQNKKIIDLLTAIKEKK